MPPTSSVNNQNTSSFKMVAIGTTEVFFSLISMVKKAKSGKDKENEENKSMTFTSYKIRNSFRKKFE